MKLKTDVPITVEGINDPLYRPFRFVDEDDAGAEVGTVLLSENPLTKTMTIDLIVSSRAGAGWRGVALLVSEARAIGYQRIGGRVGGLENQAHIARGRGTLHAWWARQGFTVIGDDVELKL